MSGRHTSIFVLFSFLLWSEGVHGSQRTSAFVGPIRSSSSEKVATHESKLNLGLDGNDFATSRRNALKDLTLSSFGLGSLLSIPYEAAHASGGATAGGAYLLSAKQRYNKRVTAVMKSFLSLSKSLEGGNLDEAKAFFATEDAGGWKDGGSAGYLLANAFRSSSATPPDSLPAVKKWKAFQAQVESLQKAVKKNDGKGALAAYQKAEEALDAYLEAVELPPVIEMRQ